MPDSGYGASLFDDANARSMASAIGSVTGKLGELTGGFTSLGTVTESVLSRLEKHLDTIKQKFSSLRGGMSLGGGGGGGAQSGQGVPGAPSSAALVPLGPQWSGRPATPDSRTGSAPPLAGMPQGTAATTASFAPMQPVAPTPVTSFTPMSNYGAGGFGGTPPALPPSMGGGGWGGGGGGYNYGPGGPPGGYGPPNAPPALPPGPTTTPTGGFPPMGPAAAESIPAALGGQINQLFSPGGFMSGAMQSAAYGTLASALGYGNATSLTRNPLGSAQGLIPYQASISDVVGTATSAMNFGLVPGSPNWNAALGGAGGMQNLMPGMNAQQAFGAATSFLSPQTMNTAIAQGMNFKPAGNVLSPAADALQILQRTFPGGVPNAGVLAESTQPGNELYNRIASLGLDPTGAAGTYIGRVGKLEAERAAKNLPQLTPDQLAKDPSLKGPYQAYQQAVTQSTKTFQEVVPAFADASACLNKAAGELLKLADIVIGPFSKAADLLVKVLGGGIFGGGKSKGVGGFLKNIGHDVISNIPVVGSIATWSGLLGGGGGGGGGSNGGSGADTGSGGSANPNAVSSGNQSAASNNWGYGNTGGGGGAGGASLGGFFSGSTGGGGSSGGSGGSGGTGSGGGGATTKLTGSSFAQQAYNFLTGKGLKDYMAAGIIGNMAQESTVNPESKGMGGGGLVGWTPLPAGLVTGNAKTDMLTQLNYLWSELNGSESGALRALQGTKNAADAATTFMNKFERPLVATENAAHRVSAAQNSLTSKGASFATGSMMIDRTQLALLHAGERVIPAAENFSAGGRYQRLNSDGGTGGPTINLNFKSGSIILQVPPGATDADMTRVANQFVTALNDPAVLAGVRSS